MSHVDEVPSIFQIGHLLFHSLSTIVEHWVGEATSNYIEVDVISRWTDSLLRLLVPFCLQHQVGMINV